MRSRLAKGEAELEIGFYMRRLTNCANAAEFLEGVPGGRGGIATGFGAFTRTTPGACYS